MSADLSSITASQLSSITASQRVPRLNAKGDKSNSADEVRAHFTQFVGETFYGQMFKAMRSTVGKPAYFHGGRGEEVFQGQLDQQMSQHLTEATGDRFADPMFERQFPHLAKKTPANDLAQLNALPRR